MSVEIRMELYSSLTSPRANTDLDWERRKVPVCAYLMNTECSQTDGTV